MELVGVSSSFKSELHQSYGQKFKVNVDNIGWDQFCTLLSNLYKILHFSVKYSDEENDLVTMTSYNDLKEAFNVTKLGDKPFVLNVIIEAVTKEQSVTFVFLHYDLHCKFQALPLDKVERETRTGFYIDQDVEKRLEAGKRLHMNLPAEIPVMIEISPNSSFQKNNFDNQQILVKKQTNCKDFIEKIAKHLSSDDSLCDFDLHIICNTNQEDVNFYRITTSDSSMSDIYTIYRSSDYFLYVAPK